MRRYAPPIRERVEEDASFLLQPRLFKIRYDEPAVLLPPMHKEDTEVQGYRR